MHDTCFPAQVGVYLLGISAPGSSAWSNPSLMFSSLNPRTSWGGKAMVSQLSEQFVLPAAPGPEVLYLCFLSSACNGLLMDGTSLEDLGWMLRCSLCTRFSLGMQKPSTLLESTMLSALGTFFLSKAASIPSFHAIGNSKTMALLVEEDQSTMLSWSDLPREPEKLVKLSGLALRLDSSPGDTRDHNFEVPDWVLYLCLTKWICFWDVAGMEPVCLQPVCLQDFNEFAQNSVLAPPVLTVSVLPCIRRECAEGLGSGNYIFLHHTRGAGSLDLEGCCKWPQPGN